MLKNYLKIAFRNLSRNKFFSIINISGLAIGMASAVLIMLWIKDELSYDRGYPKLDRLYQVWSNDKINGSIRSLDNTPEIMAPSLKKDYPEIEDVSRLQWTRNLFSSGDKKLMSTGAVVDPGFLAMFSLPLSYGNITNVLKDPHAIVLSKNLAKKLFNTDDAVGKVITMGKLENFTVSGVLKELPGNTQFNYYEYFVSYAQRSPASIDSDWTNISIPTFVLLKPNSSAEIVNSKIKNIIPLHTSGNQKTEEFLYPISKLWLYSEFENGKASGGRIVTVRAFGVIGLFILLIACINFMNLATARSEKRAKEVGIRKAVGALKSSLVGQFFGESILMAFVAGVLAIIIVVLSLPAFNRLVGKQLELDYQNIYYWLSGIGFILFTGMLAGSYPAFFLAAFKPVYVLKGGFKKINALVTPRKALVILQFTFAIILVICTLSITQQIKYAQGRKAGYDKDHLVHVLIMNDEVQKKSGLIKNELLSSGTAVAVAKVQAPLTENWSSGNSLRWEGKNPATTVQINRYSEEGDLVKTAGMQLITGRDVDLKNYPSDSTACLINESAFKLMQFKNPVGQLIYDYPTSWHVVGVIKDYVQESPYRIIKPMIIKGPRESMGTILVRLNSNRSTQQNIADMEKVFKKYNPSYPFEFSFTDEEYAKKYANEQFAGILAALFSGLTIFISCLGLFGLAAYTAESRIKEIGIRKVLGASVTNITLLLSSDFIKLVSIAVLIASPVAWWLSTKWLDSFDYRINISVWIFVLAGLSANLIALVTVGYQAIKAAMTKPVINLRTE